DRPGDLLVLGGDRLDEPGEVLRPLLRVRRGPCRQRGARGLDRTVDVTGGAGRDAADDLFGRGVLDVDRLFAVRRDPGPVDVERVANDQICHGSLHGEVDTRARSATSSPGGYVGLLLGCYLVVS